MYVSKIMHTFECMFKPFMRGCVCRLPSAANGRVCSSRSSLYEILLNVNMISDSRYPLSIGCLLVYSLTCFLTRYLLDFLFSESLIQRIRNRWPHVNRLFIGSRRRSFSFPSSRSIELFFSLFFFACFFLLYMLFLSHIYHIVSFS